MRPTSVLNHNICWRMIRIAVTIHDAKEIPARTKTQSGIIQLPQSFDHRNLNSLDWLPKLPECFLL